MGLLGQLAAARSRDLAYTDTECAGPCKTSQAASLSAWAIPWHNRGLTFGEVAEWLMAADCKSALLRVRWFESSPLHQCLLCAGFV